MVVVKYLQMFADVILRVYELLFIVRALLSWFPMTGENPIYEIVCMATEPVLAPIRNMLYRIPGFAGMPFDFSILVAYILIDILRMIFT